MKLTFTYQKVHRGLSVPLSGCDLAKVFRKSGTAVRNITRRRNLAVLRQLVLPGGSDAAPPPDWFLRRALRLGSLAAVRYLVPSLASLSTDRCGALLRWVCDVRDSPRRSRVQRYLVDRCVEEAPAALDMGLVEHVARRGSKTFLHLLLEKASRIVLTRHLMLGVLAEYKEREEAEGEYEEEEEEEEDWVMC